jgi:membrane associated rhomboid family serine protease
VHNFSSSKGKINAPHIKTENTLFGTLGLLFLLWIFNKKKRKERKIKCKSFRDDDSDDHGRDKVITI